MYCVHSVYYVYCVQCVCTRSHGVSVQTFPAVHSVAVNVVVYIVPVTSILHLLHKTHKTHTVYFSRCSVRCSGLVLCTGVVVPVQTVVVNEGNTPRGQSQEDERTTDVYFSSSERKEETKQCCSFLIRWIQSHMTWIWIVTLPLCSAEHRPLRGRPQYRYTRLQVHHVTKCSYV